MGIIKPLTSLRFFAALMVLASHYWNFTPGYSGVTFFYVLSGYVLARNYAGKVSTAAERRIFWWKRFARIYPTHVLTFLLAVPLGGSLLVAIPNLLLLQSWVPSKPIYFAFNAPSWSISDEAAFYAVFPLLIVALARSTWLKLAIWLVGLLAFAAAWSLAFPTWTNEAGSIPLWIAGKPLTAPLTHLVFYIFPPVRLIEFAIGIGIATAAPSIRLGIKSEFVALIVATISVASLGLDPRPAFAASAIFIPAAALMVLVFSRSNGPMSRFLSSRGLVILGDSSFMLYMIHWPLLMYHFCPIWLTAGVAVVLSVGLHFAFEKPVQRWLLGLDKGLAKQSSLPERPRSPGQPDRPLAE